MKRLRKPNYHLQILKQLKGDSVAIKSFRNITAYKAIKQANEEGDKETSDEVMRVLAGLHNIAEYQLAGGNSEIQLTKENIFYNEVVDYIPQAELTTKAYRGLYLQQSLLDMNNLISSIKDTIITGRLESWSKSQSYVDNKHFTSVPIPGGVPVRITATITGLYLPELWKVVREELNDDEVFGNTYGDVDELYDFEEEILAITPDNYSIYNLEEIKKEMG